MSEKKTLIIRIFTQTGSDLLSCSTMYKASLVLVIVIECGEIV